MRGSLTASVVARGAALVALALATTLAPAAAARAQGQPSAVAPVVLDGPSAPGAGPTAVTTSIARDGTGAVVYLKPVAGVAHVFASSLLGGAFQAPVQVDGALPGASSQPLVAAGLTGGLVVAFLNGSRLYVSERRNALARLSAPRVLAAGASNPAISASPFGKTYLAFTVPDGAGFDVRAAFEGAGPWAIEPTPLNLHPGDDAGTGSGRPAVTAAGDGLAIVAWGEGGHIYSRRVWGTAPSLVAEQADAPLPGCSETRADEPAIAAGGDSSLAAVAFHETAVCGGQTESRVLVDRLHGSRFDGQLAADAGLGAPPGAAERPAVVVGEYGSGWVTSESAETNNVGAQALGHNEVPGAPVAVNALPNASAAHAAPSMAGLYASIIAWQHDPAGGVPEIRARYADIDRIFGAEFVLSTPSAGPTDAAAGLSAAGDVAGDAAVAWVQSSAAGDELLAAQLYRSPGAPVPTPAPGYQRTTRPRLAWAPASELWGAVRYAVSLDGAAVGQTTARSIAVGTPVAQGRHTWQVTATNQAGCSSGTQTGRFFVDTQPPVISLGVDARGVAGRPLGVDLRASDNPAPLPAAAASGVAKIVVRWGDGTVQLIGHRRTHVYRRRGRYRLSVIVSDRAGNATVRTVGVRIVAPPKAKRRASKAPTGSPGGHG